MPETKLGGRDYPVAFNDAVIGLGSNLGERTVALQRAVRALATRTSVVDVSPIYESPAFGGPPQPDYLNAAVRLHFLGTPTGLLHLLLDLERAAGRKRTIRWGPRTLDLDILWIRDVVFSTPQLTLPHPGLCQRPFALMPLMDVAPEATDPASGVQYRSILSRLDSSSTRKISTYRLDTHRGRG